MTLDILQLARTFARYQPCIRVRASSVRILQHPPQFHDALLDMIRRAKRRIFISSLYVGSSELDLLNTLQSSIRSNPNLRIHLHLDFNRSTRPGQTSSAKILLPLLREHPSQVSVHLFRSPKLKGVLANVIPARFNEGWGTWHAKIYGADDNVMISGANLNRSYFTNRQDRYLYFTSEPALANYCFEFLNTSSKFSHNLVPRKDDATDEASYQTAWTAPSHPRHFEAFASATLNNFQQSHRLPTHTPQLFSENLDSVLLYPVIQAGQFGIREEERMLTLLFQHLLHERARSEQASVPVVDLTSGYFGLYKPYQELLFQAIQSLQTRILCAAPKANGFYESKGISGRIPEGYTLLEQRFMRSVDRLSQPRKDVASARLGIQLDEWERKGWTYHCKGIWLSPTPTSAPLLTLFGSTNLNSRSANLDTELSFLMLTPPSLSPDVLALRDALANEVRALRADARPWQGASRKVTWATKAIVKLVGGML